MKSSPCSPQLEKACAQQQRPNAAKNKIKINLKKKEEYNEVNILKCISTDHQKGALNPTWGH